jgi:hypothetical protein
VPTVAVISCFFFTLCLFPLHATGRAQYLKRCRCGSIRLRHATKKDNGLKNRPIKTAESTAIGRYLFFGDGV